MSSICLKSLRDFVKIFPTPQPVYELISAIRRLCNQAVSAILSHYKTTSYFYYNHSSTVQSRILHIYIYQTNNVLVISVFVGIAPCKMQRNNFPSGSQKCNQNTVVGHTHFTLSDHLILLFYTSACRVAKPKVDLDLRICSMRMTAQCAFMNMCHVCVVCLICVSLLVACKMNFSVYDNKVVSYPILSL